MNGNRELRQLAWRLFLLRQVIWFLKCAGRAPSKATFRRWYDLVSELAGRVFDEFRCMNYGLFDEPAHFRGWAESDLAERFPLRMYEHVAAQAAVSFEGLEALEVGSGRGGGAGFVARRFRPRRMVGLELSEVALRFARDAFSIVPGLSFEGGDAENLPFPDASFDVVLNVESSHCYPDLPRFLAEVRRVLKPGGRFTLADFRPVGEVAAFRHALATSGLEPVREEDLTARVVRALEEDSPRKERMVASSGLPGFARKAILGFAGCTGTAVHRQFRDGHRTYLALALRKPAA